MIKEIADIIFAVGLFINAVLFLPQAYRLFKSKCSKEVSFITFGGFNIIQIAATVHGYFYNDYILMIGSGLSFITCLPVTLMIIYFRIMK